MTAQELIDKRAKTNTFEWIDMAAAMLRQQAEHLDALTKERDDAYVQSLQFSAENEALLKANLDCIDHFNALKADYDSLKADAWRYKWLKQRLLCADFSYGDPSEACNALVFEIPEDMRVSADIDSSIDAMKGAT